MLRAFLNFNLIEWLKRKLIKYGENYFQERERDFYAAEIDYRRVMASDKLIKILEANTSISLDELFANYAELLRDLDFEIINWLKDKISDEAKRYFQLKKQGKLDEAKAAAGRIRDIGKLLENLNS